ncbi:MAG: DUF1177 domain-containing protein [Candidatus Bipolaricaulota bacterium]|nr:DUF1177 domain-containing protein [Candidatus Bipolaricaulota bacterium]
MLLKQLITAYELIDDPDASGERVATCFNQLNPQIMPEVKTMEGDAGSTDFVKLLIPGAQGQTKGGIAPALGIIGRLGGVGARPGKIGAVSDADGAIVTIAMGLKLADMQQKGDILNGDVILATHICPNAPTIPHKPVPFMGAPVDMETMNQLEIDQAMDAILSVDATKGNEVINNNSFAISPTVKEGYILRVSEDLLRIMRWVTGSPAVTFPLTTADITPYGNNLYHINSILQPATATNRPVVGVATTSAKLVPGTSTGANYPLGLESAARFCVEVAKEFGQGSCQLYNREEFRRITELYGSMRHLQTLGSTGD